METQPHCFEMDCWNVLSTTLQNSKHALSMSTSRLASRCPAICGAALSCSNSMILWIILRKSISNDPIAGFFCKSLKILLITSCIFWAILHGISTRRKAICVTSPRLSIPCFVSNTLYNGTPRYWKMVLARNRYCGLKSGGSSVVPSAATSILLSNSMNRVVRRKKLKKKWSTSCSWTFVGSSILGFVSLSKAYGSLDSLAPKKCFHNHWDMEPKLHVVDDDVSWYFATVIKEPFHPSGHTWYRIFDVYFRWICAQHQQ